MQTTSGKGLSDSAGAVINIREPDSSWNNMLNIIASLVCCCGQGAANTHQGPARCSSAGQLVDTVTSLGPQGCLDMWMPSRSPAGIPGQDIGSVLPLRPAANLQSTVAKIEPSH